MPNLGHVFSRRPKAQRCPLLHELRRAEAYAGEVAPVRCCIMQIIHISMQSRGILESPTRNF